MNTAVGVRTAMKSHSQDFLELSEQKKEEISFFNTA